MINQTAVTFSQLIRWADRADWSGREIYVSAMLVNAADGKLKSIAAPTDHEKTVYPAFFVEIERMRALLTRLAPQVLADCEKVDGMICREFSISGVPGMLVV